MTEALPADSPCVWELIKRRFLEVCFSHLDRHFVRVAPEAADVLVDPFEGQGLR